MNKVISIHLCGVSFQLEEIGYEALRAYLEKAERQLVSNPDKTEILADIERAIADKFRALLAAGRNVVLSVEVESVIDEMGPVTDNVSAETASPKTEPKTSASSNSAQSSAPSPSQPKRLYRLKDGAMLAGVCNGLAAFIGVDVTWLRLLVAILIFFSFGTVAIAYIVAAIIIPKAKTPEEKTAASGANPTTAQEFIRRAKEGYYEGFKTFGDREAHRAWKRKFKYEMREWNHRLRQEYRWGWWSHDTPPAPPAPTVPPIPPMANMPPPPEAVHVVMPILSTIKALLLFFCVLGILSLFTTGSLLGLPLPGHLPTWAGIVLVILAYKVAVAPIKAIRRNYYYRLNGWPVPFQPFTEFWLTLLAFAAIAFGIWLADLLSPSFHQALLNIPTFLQNASEAVRQWWGQR